MNLLGYLLSFVPRETPAPEGDPAPDPTPDPTEPTPDGQRPDWCPEKFFDPDVGVRQQQLAEAYTSLEGKIREREDQIIEKWKGEQTAELPEKYALNIAESLEIPDDVEMNLSEDDPLVGWFFDVAKEWGLSQEQVDAAINGYVEREMAAIPKIDDELAKLGDYGKDRLQRVHNWLDKSLEAEELSSLAPMLTSATTIQALEKLMKGTSPMDFDGDDPSPALTLDELRSMQNDPRYWQQKDPAFIKKVEQGYQRLFGER